MAALLSVQNLGVRRGEIWTLKSISFEVEHGQSMAIVGESGSGKSTLLWAVLGLLKADAGNISLEGLPWSNLPERSRRVRRPLIQTVFQDHQASLPPHFSGWEILQEPLVIHGRVDMRARREAAARMAERVKFPIAALDRKPRQLSGGLSQRLALARALMLKPRLLVLDEPLAALDPTLAQHLVNLLASLRTQGMSILLASHDLKAAGRLCSQTLVLRDGVMIGQERLASV